MLVGRAATCCQLAEVAVSLAEQLGEARPAAVTSPPQSRTAGLPDTAACSSGLKSPASFSENGCCLNWIVCAQSVMAHTRHRGSRPFLPFIWLLLTRFYCEIWPSLPQMVRHASEEAGSTRASSVCTLAGCAGERPWKSGKRHRSKCPLLLASTLGLFPPVACAKLLANLF